MSDTIQNIDDKGFRELINCRQNVLIKFWAPWCGPCKMLDPIVERAAGKHVEVAFAQVNVDDNPALAARFGIRALPTVQAWRDGNLFASKTGVIGDSDMDKLIKDLVQE